MKNSKSQASMDYLFTYGWIILGLAVVIGSLYYFNVFNPTMFLPESCNFGSQLECVDYSVTEEALTVRLKNNFQKGIQVTNFVSVSDEYTLGCAVLPLIAPGATGDCICEIIDGTLESTSLKKEFKAQLTFKRDAPGSAEHIIEGSVFAKVQSAE